MIIENNDKVNLNILLSNYIIYIPDMQRDYCWGITKIDNSETTLFKNFLDTLIQNFNENKTDFTMGLFYGYIENRRIYLCDGQQRITSLYLILLHACKLNKLNIDLLIYNNMPNLQYTVRDSSLFFLNDLVDYIKNVDDIINIDDIKTLDWYFDEYNNNDTIQNIIAALKTLENENNIINDDKFISYILSHINFIFIDMNTRENGEETYVLLNTTGEPLTAVENLKPYLVYNDDTTSMEKYSKKWEEIEHFFWISSNIFDNRAYAAENILEKFLNIIITAEYQKNIIDSIQNKSDESKIYNTKVPAAILKHISLGKTSDYYKNEQNIDIVYDYYINFKRFFSILNEEKQQYILKKIYLINDNNFIREYYTIIAITYYSKKFLNKDTDINDDLALKNTNRFFDFFYNILERTMEGGIDKYTIQDVITTVKKMENSDILSFLEIENSFIYKDKEEYLKLKILSDNRMYRDKLENLYQSSYKLKSFQYRILLIIDATVYNILNNDEYSFDNISTIINQNIEIFIENFSKNIDTLSQFERLQKKDFIINMIQYGAPEYPVTNNLSDIAGWLWYSPHICIHELNDIRKWLYHKRIDYKKQILFLHRVFTKDTSQSSLSWKYLIDYHGILNYANSLQRYGFDKIFYARRYINTEYEINLYTILLFHKFLQDINRVNTYLANYNKYRDENKDILKEEYQEKSKIFIWDKNENNKGDNYNRYGGIICIEKIIHDKTLVIDIYAKNEKEFILQVFFRNPHNITQNDIDKIHDIKFELIEYDVYKQVRYEAVIEHSSYENIVALCDKILESIN